MSLPTSSSVVLLRRWVSSRAWRESPETFTLIGSLWSQSRPHESILRNPLAGTVHRGHPRGLGWRCFMVQSNRSQLLRKAGQTGEREPQRTPSRLTLKPQGRWELRNAITWFGIWPAHRGEMAQQSLHPSVCQTERVYTSFTMYRRSFQRPLWLALKSPQ